ncbi:hypothetical protein DRE_04509 [Drechslerella stenobrocha 248]|uniref:Uncharacterized protein n=1 Tax=Drechslerella stenobrocha 248 TaxID=1043628 RepID=W7I232_9PEZI|nr:hypothetical protein DRE_04509 [Drechslerella stenobrocha 248]
MQQESQPEARRSWRLPDPLRLRSGVVFVTLPSLLLAGFWSAAVTYVHMYQYKLQVDEGLVPLLGIVTSLAIAFKLWASYRRYQDACTEWARLKTSTRNLTRIIWFNVPAGPRTPAPSSSYPYKPGPPPTHMQVERELREDLLSKASAIRLLVGFAFALKHHVRQEYGTEWPDVRSRVGYLPTLARRGPQAQISVSQSLYAAMDPEKGLPAIPPPGANSWPRALFFTSSGSSPTSTSPPTSASAQQQGQQNQHQQQPMAESSANTSIAQHNLPLEILAFLGSYAGHLVSEGKMEYPGGGGGVGRAFQAEMAVLNDVLGRCEALMGESMPLPYAVVVSQIKWLFLLLLPFQLLQAMTWITVPAVVIISFALLGLSQAATAISHPFTSPTLLPLDATCTALAIETDAICSSPHAHQPIIAAHSSYYSAATDPTTEKSGEGNHPHPHAHTHTGAPAWMYLKGNRPLGPLVNKDFAECVRCLSVGDILEVMKMKGEMPEG